MSCWLVLLLLSSLFKALTLKITKIDLLYRVKNLLVGSVVIVVVYSLNFEDRQDFFSRINVSWLVSLLLSPLLSKALSFKITNSHAFVSFRNR